MQKIMLNLIRMDSQSYFIIRKCKSQIGQKIGQKLVFIIIINNINKRLRIICEYMHLYMLYPIRIFIFYKIVIFDMNMKSPILYQKLPNFQGELCELC